MLDDGCKRFLLALVPLPAPVDELEAERRHPAGGPALRLECLKQGRCLRRVVAALLGGPACERVSYAVLIP